MKIEFDRVSKRFKTGSGFTDALRDLSFTVADGEFFILLGPSGCGKSTVLNLTAGLTQPSTGSIRFGETVVASPQRRIFTGPARRNVAMVFQSYALYPHMRVFENIAFPLRNQKKPPDEIREAVHRTAAMLGIEDLLTRKPKALSGGQRQRVAIARALVRQPAVFLLDEPLSNLDAQLRTSTRAELKRLQQQTAVTTLYVTHDQTEALTLGDRVALLKDGRLVQVGTPGELYRHPATPFAATFVGSPPMNLLPARVQQKAGELQIGMAGGSIVLPQELLPERFQDLIKVAREQLSADLLLGIRPEHIRIDSPDRGHLRGEITGIEPLGRENIYRIQAAGTEILVVSEKHDYRTAEPVALTFDLAALHFFKLCG